MKILITETQLKTLLFEVSSTNVAEYSYCKKNKTMGGLINGCVDWEHTLKKIGTYNNTSGSQRKEGCENKNIPDYLSGCGNHPYGSDAYLHPNAARNFNRMNKKYKEETGSDIRVESAYRDVFHQSGSGLGGGNLPKAKGGRSNHGFGLSIDVPLKEEKWIKENGGYFGWCWYGGGDHVHFNYFPILDHYKKRYQCKHKWRNRRRYKNGLPKTINIPNLPLAIEIATKFDSLIDGDNNIGTILNDESIQQYPIISKEDFEKYKNTKDDDGNLFTELYPNILVGDIFSPKDMSLKGYDDEYGGYKTKEQFLKQVIVKP